MLQKQDSQKSLSETNQQKLLNDQKQQSDLQFAQSDQQKIQKDQQQMLDEVCKGNYDVFNFFLKYGLTVNDFQPRFNKYWDNNHIQKECRGPKNHQYDYYFPIGYSGYALNVKDKYNDEDKWIKKDGNEGEWRILYHGVKAHNLRAIIDEGLKPGVRQVYRQDICQFTNKKVGDGVYFTDYIKMLESYQESDTHQFTVILQVRGRPNAIRQSQIMKTNSYYLINDSTDIRIYRILLKKINGDFIDCEGIVNETKNIVQQQMQVKERGDEISKFQSKLSNCDEEELLWQLYQLELKLQYTKFQYDYEDLIKPFKFIDSFNQCDYCLMKLEQIRLKQLLDRKQAHYPEYPKNSNEVTADNLDVLLYVLSESLKINQGRQLVITKEPSNLGLNSLLFPDAYDYSCFKIHLKKINYEDVMRDRESLSKFVQNLKYDIFNGLSFLEFPIKMEQIQILDILKGSVVPIIRLKTREQLNQEQISILEKYLGGNIHAYNFFAHQDKGKNDQHDYHFVGISKDQFDCRYNMKWNQNHKKEEKRGPTNEKYTYYFPIGYYGFALKVEQKYGNEDWIKMNGNDNEWRILYHGTNHNALFAIMEEGLNRGKRQMHQRNHCLLSKEIVGTGVYFSDLISVSEQFADLIQVGQKQYKVQIQSRVRPKAVKQSREMKEKNYFVVNETVDIRIYRILLKECKSCGCDIF